ncbi:hypothetical protein [Heliorestis acidaminivorans]|uniref:hypothetical protein n=1 Tax=Heliorestis acidaminivorans TaxID=553427 RepID=UPI0014795E26|nr:hypothetical protein [Heliorestis acidaminivorans]
MPTSSFEKEIVIETNEAAKRLAELLESNKRESSIKTSILKEIERCEALLKKLYSR